MLFLIQAAAQAKAKELESDILNLLDWIGKAERKLGSEQPLSEECVPLDQQVDEHKVLHDDITDHQEPIIKTVNDTNRFLDQNGQRLRAPERAQLRDIADNLRSRYDDVNKQSHQRLNRLVYALDDLKKYAEEGRDFESWLQNAERKLETSKRNTPEDLEGLKRQLSEQRAFNEEVNDQKGDLKFINMTGQKFIDNGKVSFRNQEQIHSEKIILKLLGIDFKVPLKKDKTLLLLF